ncbi:collagen triple helix repeat-containing protein 1-like [Oculina patagonica]
MAYGNSLFLSQQPYMPGVPGIPGIPGATGSPGRDGFKGEKGTNGKRGSPGAIGNPGKSGPRGPEGTKGEKGGKGEIGTMGIKGSAGIPGTSGLMCPKGPKGENGVGTKGEKGDAANIDPRQLANWKQCAWREYTHTDNGKIKECSFNKLHSNTALKVSYQGNIRLDSIGRCNRWYFKFNGNECSGPMTIESVLYNGLDRGIMLINRNDYFEGYCENLATGTVRVEFWVGTCTGEKHGDAHTGWNSVSRIMIEEVPPSQ